MFTILHFLILLLTLTAVIANETASFSPQPNAATNVGSVGHRNLRAHTRPSQFL